MDGSSRLGVFCKKDVLKCFAKFTGKHLCQNLFFDKVAGLRLGTSLKRRLCYGCFPVNFGKFLRTLFFIEHLLWLLLNRSIIEVVGFGTKHCVKKCPYSEFSCTYFPVFGLNMERYYLSIFIRMRENTGQKNSEYGHFSRSKSILVYKMWWFWVAGVVVVVGVSKTSRKLTSKRPQKLLTMRFRL